MKETKKHGKMISRYNDLPIQKIKNVLSFILHKNQFSEIKAL